MCACKGTNPERVINFKRKCTTNSPLDSLPEEITNDSFHEEVNIKYNSDKKRLKYKGVMSNEIRRTLVSLSDDESYVSAINFIYHKTQNLISFGEALKRCQDPEYIIMTINSKPLILSQSQKESIKALKDLLRNNFEHYIPKLWSIEIHGMPQIAIDALDVIRFLAIEIGNYTHLTNAQIQKIKSIVFQSKKFLKKTELYKEYILSQTSNYIIA